LQKTQERRTSSLHTSQFTNIGQLDSSYWTDYKRESRAFEVLKDVFIL